MHRAFVSVAFCSLFPIVIIGMAAAAEEPVRPVVYLAPSIAGPSDYPTPLLLRELIRQSLLIAARDELGLNTKDAALRESDETNDAAQRIRLDVKFLTEQCTQETIFWRDGSLPQQLDDRTTPLPPYVYQGLDIPAVVVVEERASREIYPDLLRKAGFKGQTNSVDNGSLPENIDQLLYETTLIAQFAALQEIYADIRSHGESVARLGALVRAYANLGQLTHFQWTAANKVFSARSLLYAQRMVVKFPDASTSYWHRAYALALTGLHAAALSDVTKARMDAGVPKPIAAPPWTQLIEPLCKYDLHRLTDLASDPRLGPLATFFCFIDAEHCGSDVALLDLGRATLNLNPLCFRIMAAIADRAGTGYGDMLTRMGPIVMLQTLPQEIQRLPHIPKNVQNALDSAAKSDDHFGNLANVTKAMIVANEPAEPSFSLAGRLVEETNFIHVMQRTKFITDVWGWHPDDFIGSILPLIIDHPYRRFVESFASSRNERPSVVAGLEVVDPQLHMNDLTQLVYESGTASEKLVYHRENLSVDTTAYDMEAQLQPLVHTTQTRFKSDMYEGIFAISPFCPTGAAAKIRDRWGDVATKADAWAEQYKTSPAVMGALAAKYIELDQPEKAEPVLKQYTVIAADAWAFKALANIYLVQGNEDKWLATLDSFLQLPEEIGLSHAQVQVEIAKHFMEKKEYQRALPYADTAAKTQAGWAMICDADVHRAMGDNVTADSLMQAEEQHYGHGQN
jgi:hypothetical protein